MKKQSTLFQSWNTNNTKNTNKVKTIETEFYTQIIDSEDDDDDLLNAEKSSDNTEIENLDGFDREAGRLWIYPTNYPVRSYQLNIVTSALFTNTLVSLPTGLGKTFIAAVVMYNLYRWYPRGHVIFLAPTRPLVSQQIKACISIMGLPEDDTVEMTGTMASSKRRLMYNTKRVFYLTPQTLANDIESGCCPSERIKCLIFDEAHRSTGNYAYCEIIRKIKHLSNGFRVLALSATPGKNIQAVQDVVQNLLISNIELRTEQCPDIVSYTHTKTIEKIVVTPNEDMIRIRQIFAKVYQTIVSRLKCRKLISDNYTSENLSKFMLLKFRDTFRQTAEQIGLAAIKNYIESDFMICMSLQHGLDLLQLHGLRTFHSYISGIVDGNRSNNMTRHALKDNKDMNDVLEELDSKFSKIKPITSTQMDVSQVHQNNAFSHPKIEKLRDIIIEHFEKCEGKEPSKAIIFVDYRDTVSEITEVLSSYRPIVKVISFVGQSAVNKKAGSKLYTQKDQLEVMRKFREGIYNTLVSTCVGEEGLDIGEVDLIICFDSHSSPIRMVQRMGRAGRKKNGRIIMLLTKGKEERAYNTCLYNKEKVDKAILRDSKKLNMFMGDNRLVPKDMTPRCYKLFINIPEKQVIKKSPPKLNKNKDSIKKVKENSIALQNPYLTEEEFNECKTKYKYENNFNSKSSFNNPKLLIYNKDRESEDEYIDNNAMWQTTLHTSLIGHSYSTIQLVNQMRYMDLISITDDSTIKIEKDNILEYLIMDDVIASNSIHNFFNGKKNTNHNTNMKKSAKCEDRSEIVIITDSESSNDVKQVTCEDIISNNSQELQSPTDDNIKFMQPSPDKDNNDKIVGDEECDMDTMFDDEYNLSTGDEDDINNDYKLNYPSPPNEEQIKKGMLHEEQDNNCSISFDYIMSLWEDDEMRNNYDEPAAFQSDEVLFNDYMIGSQNTMPSIQMCANVEDKLNNDEIIDNKSINDNSTSDDIHLLDDIINKEDDLYNEISKINDIDEEKYIFNAEIKHHNLSHNTYASPKNKNDINGSNWSNSDVDFLDLSIQTPNYKKSPNSSYKNLSYISEECNDSVELNKIVNPTVIESPLKEKDEIQKECNYSKDNKNIIDKILTPTIDSEKIDEYEDNDNNKENTEDDEFISDHSFDLFTSTFIDNTHSIIQNSNCNNEKSNLKPHQCEPQITNKSLIPSSENILSIGKRNSDQIASFSLTAWSDEEEDEHINNASNIRKSVNNDCSMYTYSQACNAIWNANTPKQISEKTTLFTKNNEEINPLLSPSTKPVQISKSARSISLSHGKLKNKIQDNINNCSPINSPQSSQDSPIFASFVSQKSFSNQEESLTIKNLQIEDNNILVSSDDDLLLLCDSKNKTSTPINNRKSKLLCNLSTPIIHSDKSNNFSLSSRMKENPKLSSRSYFESPNDHSNIKSKERLLHIEDDSDFKSPFKKKLLMTNKLPSSTYEDDNDNNLKNKRLRILNDSINDLSPLKSKPRLSLSSRRVHTSYKCKVQQVCGENVYNSNSSIERSINRLKRARSTVIDAKPKIVAKNSNILLKKSSIRANRLRNFVENEAVLSGSDSCDDSEGSDLDCMEDSFINDATQFTQAKLNRNDGHSIYLKSLNQNRTLEKNIDKINKQWKHNDIYSQVNISQDSYENDSFCVDNDDEFIETIHTTSDFSPPRSFQNQNTSSISSCEEGFTQVRTRNPNKNVIISSSDDD